MKYVMRLKLAEQEDLTKDRGIRDKIKARKAGEQNGEHKG